MIAHTSADITRYLPSHQHEIASDCFSSATGGASLLASALISVRYPKGSECLTDVRHKGLRALHERDDRARLPAQLVPRLRRILFRLQEATHPRSADAPGFRLHPLKGDRAGQWSVRVSGNWRVVFRFEDGEAVDVDLVDYH